MTVLITGGSANGKSTFAEKLATSFPAPLYYLATMRPYGDESLQKIARHREMRSQKGFTSAERYTDIAALEFEPYSTVLLECMCNLTANEMFGDGSRIDETAYDRILSDVLTVSRKCGNLIVVTNDVGSDVLGQYSAETLRYIDVLGKLNAALAKKFDIVYEVAAGIPLILSEDLK
jgi:adenosylcobinamide kinase/adenosylcobinamide-phosphate guanylyltransferase